jgi:hypothetical protein
MQMAHIMCLVVPIASHTSSTDTSAAACVLASPNLSMHVFFRTSTVHSHFGRDAMPRGLLEHKRLAMTSLPEWALPRLPTSEQHVSGGDAYGRVLICVMPSIGAMRPPVCLQLHLQEVRHLKSTP